MGKSRPNKKGGEKKKVAEKNEAKRYVLSVFRDGAWYQSTPEEITEFIKTNQEVASYLLDPNLLNTIPSIPGSALIYDHWEKAADKIMTYLWKMHGAWNFHAPVDPVALCIPDYYTIVKEPMDFGTIKKKLTDHVYMTCKEFVDDVELVFSNCINYNGEKTEFGKLARTTREEFKRQCQLYHLDYYIPS